MKSSAGRVRYAKIVHVEVFDDRVCALGEGPHYDERTERVMWVDILGGRLLWRDLETGTPGESAVDGHVGAAVPRENGGLVVCLPDGPALLDPDGTLRLLGTYPHPPNVRMRSNDAKADPAGRLWLGTMAYDETPGAGTLYRLDPGASNPVPMVKNVTVSNGLGWSPDGGTMYYNDSPTRRVDAFEYDPATGAAGERRPFVEFEEDWGFPDGMCVDAAGAIWVACWTGAAVRRFTPDGQLDRVVTLDTPLVTSCAFAGPGYEQLVITTARSKERAGDPAAGLTYLHRPRGVTGRPVDRFAG